jgi:hypothetical protein
VIKGRLLAGCQLIYTTAALTILYGVGILEGTRIAVLENILYYMLVAALLLCVAAFLFIFCINWEDWFFGTRIEGLSAGVALFLKAAAAGVLLGLALRYRWRINWIAPLALLYFGFLAADSTVTIRKTTGDPAAFSVFFIALCLIPLAYLAVRNLPGFYNRAGKGIS